MINLSTDFFAVRQASDLSGAKIIFYLMNENRAFR